MENVDMMQSHLKPFVVNNQVLILGNPVIRAETLQQLTKALDQAGLDKPIVIINPESNDVPDFEANLSNLIQSNRSFPMLNVTTADKYTFKDCSDAELTFYVQKEVSQNPRIDFDSLLNIYQGLRARAQALFSLESLCRERDWIWSQHLANPQVDVGFARYQLLVNQMIPQAQSYYAWVCERLSTLKVIYKEIPESVPDASPDISEPVTEEVIDEPVPTDRGSDGEGAVIESPPTDMPSVKLWGPWNTILNMQMPITNAKSLVASSYAGLRSQQKDVELQGKMYKAVEPEILLALGVDIYPDGVPICYTELGTFRRVGKSDHPVSDISYWYPKPKVKELM